MTNMKRVYGMLLSKATHNSENRIPAVTRVQCLAGEPQAGSSLSGMGIETTTFPSQTQRPNSQGHRPLTGQNEHLRKRRESPCTLKRGNQHLYSFM